MTGADTNPAPKAMDPEKLRALCATAAGRAIVEKQVAMLRTARAEYVDANLPRVEAIRSELVKAEATVAEHLAAVDRHIAACESALGSTGQVAA